MQKTITDSKIYLRLPNDMHVHFRTGSVLKAVVPYTARQFRRAVVMPNTPVPITTTQLAIAYRQEILGALPQNTDFCPLLMAYLTDQTNPEDIAEGFTKGIFFGAKLYPAHVTTNSTFGVTNIQNISPVLQVMEQIGMPLSIHGEVARKEVDIYEREKVFIQEVLVKILSKYPNLKVTLEHISTKDAVDFLRGAGQKLAATITPQHLLYNRNAMLAGAIRPHLYCLPILKQEKHRLALIELATSGFKRVFLGTDSAPHTRGNKECTHGCAGIFSAMHALEIYTHIFAQHGALTTLESFTTLNANAFHSLKTSDHTLCIVKGQTSVPKSIMTEGGDTIVPMCAEQTLSWQVQYAKTSP